MKMHMREKGLLEFNAYNMPCQHCGKTFQTKSGLNKHVRTIHEGIRGPKLNCPDCENVYNTSGALHHHRKAAHGYKAKTYKGRIASMSLSTGMAIKPDADNY